MEAGAQSERTADNLDLEGSFVGPQGEDAKLVACLQEQVPITSNLPFHETLSPHARYWNVTLIMQGYHPKSWIVESQPGPQQPAGPYVQVLYPPAAGQPVDLGPQITLLQDPQTQSTLELAGAIGAHAIQAVTQTAAPKPAGSAYASNQ